MKIRPTVVEFNGVKYVQIKCVEYDCDGCAHSPLKPGSGRKCQEFRKLLRTTMGIDNQDINVCMTRELLPAHHVHWLTIEDAALKRLTE